jgi:hypothetical protein
MTPKIVDAVPMTNYEVLITYENNERRIFDIQPYFSIGLFSDLRNESLFKTVKVSFDTIEWINGMDIDPEELYEKSKKVKSESIA